MQDLRRYVELVFSCDLLLLEVIKENLGCKNTFYASALAEFAHINLLIVDLHSENLEHLVKKAKHIINFTGLKLTNKEININKPFRFQDLAEHIIHCRSDKYLFYALEKDIIYDEQANSIRTNSFDILMTAKESILLKTLILAPNNQISKEELLENVWNYSSFADSLTVETHLYRLKNKLPKDMLKINSANKSVYLSTMANKP